MAANGVRRTFGGTVEGGCMTNLRWLASLAGCMLGGAAVLGGLAVMTSGDLKGLFWSVPLGALIGFGLGVGIEQNFRPATEARDDSLEE
jgi:hypothetical protein